MTDTTAGNGSRTRLMADWLPLVGIAVAGLVGWGSMNNSVTELQRRVGTIEQQQSSRQGDDTRVAVQLAALDANMTALRAQVADIADQLRRPRQ